MAKKPETESASEAAASTSSGQGTTPDFAALLRQFQIPGLDVGSLIDRERKNIEALGEANRIAFQGAQSLLRRQAEILQETMQQCQSSLQAAPGEADKALQNRTDQARQAFEKALANMRELAEIAAKSQNEAFDVIRRRIEENVQAVSGTRPQN